MKQLTVTLLLIVLVIVIGIYGYAKIIENGKITRTKEQVKKLAKTPMDYRADGLMPELRDIYGQSLRFNRTEDDYGITQKVSSAGPDGVWDTTDDIVCEDTDLNKSKLLGQWAGQKSKEFIKGFKNPLPSRFKSTE